MLAHRILSAGFRAFLIFLFSVSVLAQGQVGVTPDEELNKRINVNYTVDTLTTDLFGDQVDLYTGSLSFLQTDVSLQGGNNLSVAISRSFEVGGYVKLGGPGPRGLFGDWLLELPRVQSIQARQHLDQDYGRCYRAPYAPGVAFPDTYPGGVPPFMDYEYSQGHHLVIPGAGSQELMMRFGGEYTQAPGGASGAYKMVTKNHWQVRCVTANGTPSTSGEGYLAVSPDGTRYYLTHFVTRPAPLMEAPEEFKAWLFRDVVQAWPSKVVDRFGNEVVYSYDAQGRLSRIEADDGREISVAYNANGQIASVTAWPDTAQARTWRYFYDGNEYHPALKRIDLPDHSSTHPSQWHFNLEEFVNAQISYSDTGQCGQPTSVTIGPNPFPVATMTHPMGVTGEFKIGVVRHGRANVTYDCRRKTVNSPWQLWTPRDIYTMSLIDKKLSGPGLVPMDWDYGYSHTPGWFNNPPMPDSTPHAEEKWIVITDPAGKRTQYYFDITWDATEGQLRKTEYRNAAGALLRTEEKTYTLTAFRMDSVQDRVNAQKAGRTSLLNTVLIKENSDTYTRQLSSYDVFDNPGNATLSNNIPGQTTRTETYTYINDTSVTGAASASMPLATVWVIGLPDTTTVNGITTTDYTYDNNTLLLSSVKKFGVTTAQFGWHPDGTLNWFDDALDKRTTYTDYKLGIPRLIAYPDGTDLDLVVNADGTIASKTDVLGNITSYTYDVMGRLSRINWPGSWSDTLIDFEPVTSTEYGIAAGHWRQIVTRGDNETRTYFDGLLRPAITRQRDIGGQSIFTSRAFDHAGREVFAGYPTYTAPAYDPATIATTDGTATTFDALGRITRIEDTTDSSATQITYLGDNIKQITDPLGNVTRYEYRVFDQPAYDVVTKTIAAWNTPEQSSTSITRDSLGRMTAATQSGSYGGSSVSATRSYVYDSRGQLCKRVDPETGQSVFRYDNAGNLVWSATNVAGSPTACEAGVTDTTFGSIPASQVVVNTYDDRNRLLAVDYPTGTADTCHSYDAVGNNTRTATLSEYGSTCPTSGTLTRWDYVYNSLNLLTSETLAVDAQSFALAYGYNSNGNMNQITYPTGRVFSLAPDGLGRPTSVGGLATAVTYHPSGQLASYVNGNGLVNEISLNDKQMPEYLKVLTDTGTTHMKWHYTYDAALNTKNIVDDALQMTIAGNLQYDALNRLTDATGTWGTATYAYDPLGNLRQQSINGGTFTYTYNSASNRLTGITGSVSRAYTYDPLGNVTADGVHSYDYDLANRLTTVTGIAGYAYDGHGKRVKHTDTASGEVTYSVYSLAGKRLHQYNASTATPEDFVYLGNRILAKLAGPPVVPGTSSITFSGGTQDGNYTVTWTAATNADSYALFERKIGAAWASVYQGKTRSYPVSGKTGGGYQYQLQACSYDGCGAWITSGIASVTPPAPASISTPTGTYTDNNYTVSWPVSVGATSYTLREQVNGGSWHTVTVPDPLDRSIPFNNGEGSYRYAVKACNAYADCSDYRYSSTFTIQLPPDTPVLSAPGSSNWAGVYTVSWTAETGATRYELQERVGMAGSWAEIQDGSALYKTLLKSVNATYGYRARACKSVACSGWSNIKNVQVALTGGGGGCLSGGSTAPSTQSADSQTASAEGGASVLAPPGPCLQGQTTDGPAITSPVPSSEGGE